MFYILAVSRWYLTILWLKCHCANFFHISNILREKVKNHFYSTSTLIYIYRYSIIMTSMFFKIESMYIEKYSIYFTDCSLLLTEKKRDNKNWHIHEGVQSKHVTFFIYSERFKTPRTYIFHFCLSCKIPVDFSPLSFKLINRFWT